MSGDLPVVRIVKIFLVFLALLGALPLAAQSNEEVLKLFEAEQLVAQGRPLADSQEQELSALAAVAEDNQNTALVNRVQMTLVLSELLKQPAPAQENLSEARKPPTEESRQFLKGLSTSAVVAGVAGLGLTIAGVTEALQARIDNRPGLVPYAVAYAGAGVLFISTLTYLLSEAAQ